MQEEFRAIPGFEGLYSISPSGRIYSHPKERDFYLSAGKYMKNYLHKGADRITLHKGLKCFERRIDELVKLVYGETK